jgi:hypothetical protein
MFGNDSGREDGEEFQLVAYSQVKAKIRLNPGTAFQIKADSHKGRTHIVRTSDGAGITAWDATEMQYAEKKRTLYCINSIPLNGFVKSGQFKSVSVATVAV